MAFHAVAERRVMDDRTVVVPAHPRAGSTELSCWKVEMASLTIGYQEKYEKQIGGARRNP